MSTKSDASDGATTTTEAAVQRLETIVQFSTFIRGLVDEVGPEILTEPDRMRAFLMDEFPDKRREIRALHTAACEDIPKSLRAVAANEKQLDIETQRQIATLEQQLGLSSSLASWTVNVFALALRVSTVANAPEPAAEVVSPAPAGETAQPAGPAANSGGTQPQNGAAAPAQPPAEPPAQPTPTDSPPFEAPIFRDAGGAATTTPPRFRWRSRTTYAIGGGVALLLVGAVIVALLSPARVVHTSGDASSLLVPDGQYTATRGWTDPSDNPDVCASSYPSFPVSVANGRITFSSGGDNWEGEINQRTGYLNVKDLTDGGVVIVDGDYRNARMTGDLACKEGFFRFD